jgi:dephospho-CoA kinase
VLVGLTGGVGSGKSAALDAFARQGCATLSSDAVVRELYATRAVRDAVVDRLGAQALAPDGSVDRGRLAAVAFEDPAVLRFLERLLHPLVADALAAAVAAAAEQGRALLVHEVPLLFEADLAGRYDVVVVVTASDAVRRRRAGERFARARHQLPEEQKARLANEVYVNDGTLEELEAWVGAVVRRLAAGAA